VTKHTPNPDPEVFIVPDTSEGAFTQCDCAECREARLADPDRITYTAHQMADAYTQGCKDGATRTVARLAGVLNDWLLPHA
jgi:hypothetical protein